MRLVKAAKASPHAKFYNLSTDYNYIATALAARTQIYYKNITVSYVNTI